MRAVAYALLDPRRVTAAGERAMIQGLYTAGSGMAAHLARVEVLANNLANADTPGFKADLLTIDPSAEAPAAFTPALSPTVTVGPGRPGLDASPGAVKFTGNPLDLAILGPGMFVVETPQGERYTRAGAFTRDAAGFLATPQGFRVLGTAGPIRVPEDGFRVDVAGRLPGGAALRLVEGPAGPERLAKVGGNLYAAAEGAAPPADLQDFSVAQGQLEASNVNVVRTMVELLVSLRAYEGHQRAIQAIDQTAGQAASDLGRA